MEPEQLLRITAGRKGRDAAGRLGGAARVYLDRRSRQLKKNASVVDIWEEILPAELSSHCKIAGITAGVMVVYAEPGVYMHEIQLLGDAMVRQLQSRCPAAGIKKIVVRPSRTAKVYDGETKQ